MKVVISWSMAFASEMREIKELCEKVWHAVILPDNVEDFLAWKKNKEAEALNPKIKWGLIKKHYHKIEESDALLVVNIQKNAIAWYVGACSLIEMGFAYILNKPIFLRNEIPDMSYTDEIKALEPMVIYQNIEKVK